MEVPSGRDPPDSPGRPGQTDRSRTRDYSSPPQRKTPEHFDLSPTAHFPEPEADRSRTRDYGHQPKENSPESIPSDLPDLIEADPKDFPPEDPPSPSRQSRSHDPILPTIEPSADETQLYEPIDKKAKIDQFPQPQSVPQSHRPSSSSGPMLPIQEEEEEDQEDTVLKEDQLFNDSCAQTVYSTHDYFQHKVF